MVGDTALRVVIGADLGTTVAGRDHGLSARRDVVDIFLVLLIIYLRTQARERALFVLRLVACLRTFDEYLLGLARIGVLPVITKPHARLHLVDVLTAGTARSERLPFDLALVDMHLKLIRLGQYRDRRRRGMYPALRLRHRHALHAVYATLVLERPIDVLARDVEDDLLVSARSTFRKGRDGIFESLDLEILGVHPEEVSGEDSRFVAACTAADLHDHVLPVLGILRQELQLQLLFELRDLRFKFIDLRFRHLFHLRVALVVKQVLRVLQVRHGFLVSMCTLQHPLQVMVITIQTHVPRLIGYHRRVRNQQTHLVKLCL